MIRTKLARRVLSKREQDHLSACGINSVSAMKRQVDFMERQSENGGQFDLFELRVGCSRCWFIAKKLGLIKS